MWIDAKTFMELVQNQERMRAEFTLRMSEMEKRIEALEKRPISIANDNGSIDSTDAMEKLYHEMTDGVIDEKARRVIFTDGRE